MEKNYKVHVVEDNDVLGDVIVKKLSDSGYIPKLTRDGGQAISDMREFKPDLVLLDIILPHKNGYEILEEKQKDQKLEKIPVIVISNSGQPVEISRVLALGVKDYLVKAEFSPEEVLKKVNDQLMRLSKPTVLENTFSIVVVEDDNFLRDLLARRLAQENCKVRYAVDGERALEMIDQEKPDVILLDIILPGIDGFEVLKRIKGNEANKKVRIIVLSNLGQEEDMEKARKLGADDFLVKANFNMDEILEKVRTLVAGKPS